MPFNNCTLHHEPGSSPPLIILDDTQPTRVARWGHQRKWRISRAFRLGIVLGLVFGTYLFFPGRINVLLLGIDRTPENSAVGRSDTLMLTTTLPLQGYFGMLSIPRDLWVAIPDHGENRINTAHFFAEAESPGTGPDASVETIVTNFGIDLEYYIRIQFDGFRSFIDALGGMPIDLESPVGEIPAGAYILDGEQALAFVRERSGGDDFTRMANGQTFVKAVLEHMIHPTTWPRLPIAMVQLYSAMDSNLPAWIWPRYVFALSRLGLQAIDARMISRDMVKGFSTSEGAQVLAPEWNRINPLLLEMFGQ
jgi:LCP family protein required for cell wall assembly